MRLRALRRKNGKTILKSNFLFFRNAEKMTVSGWQCKWNSGRIPLFLAFGGRGRIIFCYL